MRDFTKAVLKFLGGVAVVLAIVAAILYFFFVRVVEVGHNAMAPTVIMGDRVLVWRTTDVELGEIVLCEHPEQPGRYVMGRVVGTPGTRVAIERGQLRINGQVPDLDLQGDVRFADMETGRNRTMQLGLEDILDHDHHIFRENGRQMRDMRLRQVGAGYFLLSDNRNYLGEDSRSFGEVVANTCIGNVFMRLTAAESPPEIGNSALDIIE